MGLLKSMALNQQNNSLKPRPNIGGKSIQLRLYLFVQNLDGPLHGLTLLQKHHAHAFFPI